MNCLFSSSCDPSNENLDACYHKPCLCAGDGGLEILGEASFAAEPGKRPFDDPSSGQQHEAFGRVRALDDLQRPLAKFGQRRLELREA